jgi:hypothetical protein
MIGCYFSHTVGISFKTGQIMNPRWLLIIHDTGCVLPIVELEGAVVALQRKRRRRRARI